MIHSTPEGVRYISYHFLSNMHIRWIPYVFDTYFESIQYPSDMLKKQPKICQKC